MLCICVKERERAWGADSGFQIAVRLGFPHHLMRNSLRSNSNTQSLRPSKRQPAAALKSIPPLCELRMHDRHASARVFIKLNRSATDSSFSSFRAQIIAPNNDMSSESLNWIRTEMVLRYFSHAQVTSSKFHQRSKLRINFVVRFRLRFFSRFVLFVGANKSIQFTIDSVEKLFHLVNGLIAFLQFAATNGIEQKTTNDEIDRFSLSFFPRVVYRRDIESQKSVDDEVCVIVVKVMEGVVNVDDDYGREGNENIMMTMSPIFPLRRDKSSFFAKCLQILIRFNHLYCQACESCVTVSVSSSVPIVVCDASERIECAWDEKGR